MEIKSVAKEDTAYDKYLRFTHEGQEYSVILHWDKWDGYELQFTELDVTRKWIDTPDWAIDWEDEYNDTLAQKLDELTDEIIEESYK
jgi:hypothetical protein